MVPYSGGKGRRREPGRAGASPVERRERRAGCGGRPRLAREGGRRQSRSQSFPRLAAPDRRRALRAIRRVALLLREAAEAGFAPAARNCAICARASSLPRGFRGRRALVSHRSRGWGRGIADRVTLLFSSAGRPRSPSDAVEQLLRRAAANGHANAAFELGVACCTGYGTLAMSRKRAALRGGGGGGDKVAMFNWGVCCAMVSELRPTGRVAAHGSRERRRLD